MNRKSKLITALLLVASGMVQAKTSLLAILKAYKDYDTVSTDFPKFTILDASDSNLAGLRKLYQLDSIAGDGSDISRAQHLLTWLHNTVPHEDEYNPEILTAQNIIETYRLQKTGQGCYPLAIAMNEILLSMGFKSRIVICFPADFEHPNGGHVINSVYMPSLKKWIWMDPQFNAWLKDDSGNYLSIAEVRERLIQGRPVSINKEANYHGKKTNTKYYLQGFMLEHLYRFITPLNSKYDSETRSTGKVLSYVELLPLGSKTPASGTFESHERNGVKVITTHTFNATLFWQGGQP